MNSEVRSIILTIIAGACVASTVELWHSHGRALGVPVNAPLTVPAAGSAVATGSRESPPRTPAAAPESAVEAAAGVDRPTAPAAPAATEDSTEGQPGEPLPVAVHIRNRRELNLIDGDIRNIASKPLAITLRAVSSSTQSTSEIHFDLAPGERRLYSSNDGLNMQTDDQLILQSPPYQERVVRVP